jgi:hypothetical protein
VEDGGHPFNSLDLRDHGVDVDSSAHGNGIACPVSELPRILAMQAYDVTDPVWSTADLINLGVQLDHGPKLKGSGVGFEISDINCGSDEVRGILWETKV